MNKKSKSTNKYTPLRWSIRQAATEFNRHTETVTKRLKTAGILAGPDGLFSTAQIIEAIFGDIQSERLRKCRLEADLLAIEKRKLDGELVATAEIKPVIDNLCVSIRQVIAKSEHLTEQQRHKLCEEIKAMRVEEVIVSALAPLYENQTTDTTED